MEGARILGYHVQFPTQGTESPAIDAVAVSGALNIRPCLVDGGMNHKCGGIE